MEPQSSSSNTPNRSPLPPKELAIGLVILCFAVGFIGGMLALRVVGDSFKSSESAGQEIILQENEVIANVAETVSPSVVSIAVGSTETDPFFGSSVLQESSGTGIIISSDGVVLTNRHVVPEGVSELRVVLSDGTEYSDVQVIGRDRFNDLAYLKINGGENLKPATLGDSNNVRVGEKVIAIGNALGQFNNTVTSGIISGIGRPITAGDEFTGVESLQNLFQTDAAINPGNSGGPLVNTKGEVIGVNTAVADAENIGFAIPINDAKGGIASVEANGDLVQPYLGVQFVTITPDVAKEFNLPVDRGAYIFTEGGSPIVPNSPAQKAGLQAEDIIVEVNGTKIDERNSLVGLVSQYKVGETIELKIIRGGQEQSIQVTLEEVPSNL